jgi:hypothetical protein
MESRSTHSSKRASAPSTRPAYSNEGGHGTGPRPVATPVSGRDLLQHALHGVPLAGIGEGTGRLEARALCGLPAGQIRNAFHGEAPGPGAFP